jgi:CRP/FNR family transcriptional regulator, dissimilatory nitrate respiration regulator
MKTLRTSAADRDALLAASPLFADLPAADRAALAAKTSLVSFAPGENLFLEGKKAEGFFVVAKGRVKVYRVSAAGREQVFHVMGPGEAVGEVAAFQGGTWPASASAAGDVDALYLTRNGFIELGRRRPEAMLSMLAVLAARLRRFVNLIDDLSLKEVSGRLAQHLLELARRSGEAEVRLETAKSVLAARLGTSPETLSRTLGKMEERGMIQVKGRTIRILDAGLVRRAAEGEKL